MNNQKPQKLWSVMVLFLLAITLIVAQAPAWSVKASGSPATYSLSTPVTIYDDRLASGWQDWSWNATRSFSNRSPVQSGPSSIAVTITRAWGALYLHRDTSLSTIGYTHLEFSIHGGTSGKQRINVFVNGDSSRSFLITPAANQWTKLSIPLSELGGPASLTGVTWQDASGAAQPKFYLDAVSLVDRSLPTATVAMTATSLKTATSTRAASATPTKTATAVATKTATPVVTKPATAVPTQTGGVTIYADQLDAGWQNWSWSTTSNLANTSPVQAGSRSIAVTHTAGWAALYFHANAPLSTTGYTSLRFWVHGGAAGGQKVRLAVNGNTERGYAFTLPANQWSLVEVSLASLGNPANIVDLWWQDTSGGAQPTFYVDTVSLASGSGIPQPTALPTTQPPSPTPVQTQSPGTNYFTTLPPGSKLPSDAECASMIKRKPENKRVNVTANATRGSQTLAPDFFGSAVDPRANSEIASRVTGNFVGTTDEILQWAACKWGVDEDMVRAQAAVESWWRQDTKGDWTTNSANCAPGHGLGVDGTAGQCPESWGILQNRYPYEKSSWPGILNSTAFNADTAYGIWRSCFEGYEYWLNDVERGRDYSAGDAYGCMGRWFSGRWHTQAAEDYIGRVKDYLNTRIWETANFQEP